MTKSGMARLSSFSGHAIKFCRNFSFFSFQESVIELLGGYYNMQTVIRPSQKAPKPVEKQFELPEANSDMRRVFAYLTKQRFGIGGSTAILQ